MLGAVVNSSARSARRDHAGAAPTILHLAPTRSATVRLAPIAGALPAPQARVDAAGLVTPWSLTTPVVPVPSRSAAELSRAVTDALHELRPDAVVLAGDDDAAMVCALAATRAGVPIARIGAGLRCGDRGLKREINRIAIDELATRLYTDGEAADERLRAEGFDDETIRRVGSPLAASVARWRGLALERAAWDRLELRRGQYILVALHRPESFAQPERVVAALTALAKRHSVVVCGDERLPHILADITMLEPTADYPHFLSLQAGAGAVVTDSSGVQEETTVLGVACFTLAGSSERTLTLTHGTNSLLGDDPAAIAEVTVSRSGETEEPIPMWDGDVGGRVAADLLDAPWRSA